MPGFSKVSSVGIGATGTMTRPANTNTYTANDVIGTAVAGTSIMTFSLSPTPLGAHFILMGASLRVDLSAVPVSMGGFKLHLYSALPTGIVDEAEFNLPAADRDKYYGFVQFDLPTELGDTLYTMKDNLNMKRKLADTSDVVYGILQTESALVGASGTVFTVKLHAVQA